MPNQPLSADLVREMEEALREARDIYTWMTGSSDFGEGGMAEAGWKKTDQNRKQIDAVIAKLDALREPPDRAEVVRDEIALRLGLTLTDEDWKFVETTISQAYAPLLAQHEQERESWKRKEDVARLLNDYCEPGCGMDCDCGGREGHREAVTRFRTAFGLGK